MTRNLKTIGFALLSFLAMGAIAASAAQATPVGTIEGASSSILSGTSGGLEGQEKITLFGSTIECEKSEFSGEIENGSSTLTVFAVYGPECKIFGGLPGTVTTNGCHYVYHLTEKVAADKYKAHVDIVCEEGKQIELHVYGSQTAHANSTALCTVKIPAQSGLTSLTFTTKTTAERNFGDAEVSGKIEGIHMTQIRNSFLCPSGTETNTAVWEINTPTTLVGNHDFDISGD